MFDRHVFFKLAYRNSFDSDGIFELSLRFHSFSFLLIYVALFSEVNISPEQRHTVLCCYLNLLVSRLDVYIHDYLVKRDLKATAQAFQAEGKVSSDPVGVYTEC